MAMRTHSGLRLGELSLPLTHQYAQTVTAGANGAGSAWRGSGAVPASITLAEE